MTRRLSLALIGATLTLTLHAPAQPQGTETPAVPIRVALAVEQAMEPTVWVSGTVVSRHDARLAAEIPGRLEWVAEIGDIIPRGKPFARLDAHLLDLTVQQDDIKIQRLQVNVDYLKKEVKRLQSLTEQQIAARNQLDALLNSLGTAEQDLKEAKVVRQQNLHRLRSASVVAPFPGQVVERLLQPGEYTNVGIPIVRLVDVTHAEVRAQAPLDVAPHLSNGQSVEVKDDDHQMAGIVRATVPVGDERSRMFEVRATLPDGHPWVLGAPIRVALPHAPRQRVVAVPRDALVLRQGESYVFKVVSGSVRRVDIVAGAGEGDWIEARGSLAAGDRVVIRGAERLQDGQAVTVQSDS